MPLYGEADGSARIAVDGTTVHVAFGVKPTPTSFGGQTHHVRSVNNGATWGPPVAVGDNASESRQQVAAADGRVIIMWQQEATTPGGALPADRLGRD